jgi:hypothetical protein
MSLRLDYIVIGSSCSNPEYVDYEIELFIFGLLIGVMCYNSSFRN